MRTVSPSNAGAIPRGSSASRSAWKLSCVRCVRNVRSAPISDAAFDGFGNAQMRRMLRAEQRVDHEHLRAAHDVDRLGGKRLRVGDVRERADAIGEHREAAVRNARRRDVDVGDGERLSRLDGVRLALGLGRAGRGTECRRRRCSGTSPPAPRAFPRSHRSAAAPSRRTVIVRRSSMPCVWSA